MWGPSSLTGDQTHLPCNGQQILNNWTTKEGPSEVYLCATKFKNHHPRIAILKGWNITQSQKRMKECLFAATWMDLEIDILSEVRQRITNLISYQLYVDSKRIIQINLFIKHKQTHRHRKTAWLPKGKGGGGRE